MPPLAALSPTWAAMYLIEQAGVATVPGGARAEDVVPPPILVAVQSGGARVAAEV